MLDLGPWLVPELGRKGEISVDDWAEIRRLHFSEGVSIKELVRRTGHLAEHDPRSVAFEAPPSYVRAAKAVGVDAVDGEIRRLLMSIRGCRRR